MPSIAIVGMACRYPDARSPAELWENVLAQRRAFRRIPSERLRLEDYYSSDPAHTDSTYLTQAALIEGYEFDRLRYRVSADTFRSVDLAHWLALDTAAGALADAGFLEGNDLPRDSTGVLVGNSLTGEFSRASVLRLRWPFVRRVADHALAQEGVTTKQRESILETLQATYLKPFPQTTEESLAGGLSNVIAGRICNHFNLRGGGYTLDGACASSLLAVTSAATALVSGDLDVALAGGVDLSLDPFELVGFARVGALARGEMRVFDTRSEGFLPGEGCGFVVLMRHEDAVRQNRRIYAVIRGWGISSDGAGGITRPEVEGQMLALQRAYRRAGVGIDTVTYFEGHGTGTPVGDLVELQALARARNESRKPKTENRQPECPDSDVSTFDFSPAYIGSVKANIGHTKAAAGMAGLIKAVMALDHQILPPTTGCPTPRSELATDAGAPVVLQEAISWPTDRPLRAGVSSMGFGGINTHIVLEGAVATRRVTGETREQELRTSSQDAELFLLGAADRDELLKQVERVLSVAPRLSLAELTDLAAELSRALPRGPARAAIVAGTPQELVDRLEVVRTSLRSGLAGRIDASGGVFLSGPASVSPRITFLFPGQGGPLQRSGGALARRFGFVKNLFASSEIDSQSLAFSGCVVQPATVRTCLAGMHVLTHLGIHAERAAGHSLGELVALHWAGAMDEDALVRIAQMRGKAMDQLAHPGAMAAIGASAAQVRELLNGLVVCVACVNSERQTVVSGEAPAVTSLVSAAQARGFWASMLQTTHAFHSLLVSEIVPAFEKQLGLERFGPLTRTVVSTVTGAPLAAGEDLQQLLCKQVISPVLFSAATEVLVPQTDLFIEVGAGDVLTRFVSEAGGVPAVALEVGGDSLRGLLHAVGAAFALGMPVTFDRLFADRLTRPFDLDRPLRFFANPCEKAPVTPDRKRSETARRSPAADRPVETGNREPAIDVLKQVLQERLELPAQTLRESDHLLRDLHLNSLSVGQIVAESARRLGLPRPASPTEYAQATVGEVARTLDQLRRLGPGTGDEKLSRFPAGVDSWVRAFTMELRESRCAAGLPPAKLDLGASTQHTAHSDQQGTWQVFGAPGDPLRARLSEAFLKAGGSGGVVVCLPPQPDDRVIPLLLEGAKHVLALPDPTTFVVVQHRGGGGAFARTLCLEAPRVRTCVVDLPPDHPEAVQWVLQEARCAAGYREAHYDASGRRYEPFLCLLTPQAGSRSLPVSRSDVMLVTGGGKGIAAECALSLARDSGVRLALLGRSAPQADTELAANLERLKAAGVQFRYLQTDVTDEGAVRQAVAAVEQELGPITAVLHGAGNNVPQPIQALDENAFRRTLAPKFQGLVNVLSAVPANQLRLLVTFGSVIARTGFRGEADYALANERVAHLTERFQSEHPQCRCLCVEWSIWSGVGMGERLGRVGALLQEGITPITPDQGVSILHRLLCEAAPPCVVVSGRLGQPPTVQIDEPPLPNWRFLQDKKVYYPGIELVVDSHLSSDSDLYVDDHVFGIDRLFPAVMGLEAMAQAAAALLGSTLLPTFEKVEFHSPIIVPDGQTTTLRLAAILHEPNCVEVCLRTSATEFQVDHFRATCRFAAGPSEVATQKPEFDVARHGERIPLIPSEDLYGQHLFQKGRFQRLEGYRRLSARECIADLAGDGAFRWFGPGLPSERLLGDPGLRDAALHAVQACVPHKVVLPVSVERIRILRPAGGPCSVEAVERERRGDLFTYDLDLLDSTGCVVETWQGLRLKATQLVKRSKAWPAALLKPLLEREFFRVLGGRVVDVVIGPVEGRECAQAVALKHELEGVQHAMVGSVPGLAIENSTQLLHRPDGKPFLEKIGSPGGVEGNGTNGKHREVSFAYGGGLLLGISGDGVLGCDMEAVLHRPASDWEAVLGSSGCSLARQISGLAGEDFDTAATRVWTVLEAAKKAGLPPDTPLTVRERPAGRLASPNSTEPWVVSVGAARAATCSVSVEGCAEPLIVTALTASRHSDSQTRRTGPISVKSYEYRHVVTFEDTNLLGNVYYVNYLSWQGRCREMFLRDHAPAILAQLRADLRLVTVRVSCNFVVEVAAFDELLIRMSLKARKGNRLKLAFEYLRMENGQPVTVARGIQVLACMRREGDHLLATPIPQVLLEALKPFSGGSVWRD